MSGKDRGCMVQTQFDIDKVQIYISAYSISILRICNFCNLSYELSVVIFAVDKAKL